LLGYDLPSERSKYRAGMDVHRVLDDRLLSSNLRKLRLTKRRGAFHPFRRHMASGRYREPVRGSDGGLVTHRYHSGRL
ncbi:hypothetical protein FRB90_009766, partial [Tulasnella sp. 427]